MLRPIDEAACQDLAQMLRRTDPIVWSFEAELAAKIQAMSVSEVGFRLREHFRAFALGVHLHSGFVPPMPIDSSFAPSVFGMN